MQLLFLRCSFSLIALCAILGGMIGIFNIIQHPGEVLENIIVLTVEIFLIIFSSYGIVKAWRKL